MEAVPRLPMLSFELKISPVCPDFATPFKRFISKYYGEDGDLYDREIVELENLRNSACRISRDVTGCCLLKRYYCQIYSLFNRFAAFENQIGVQCAWADIYSGQTSIGDLDFELACILYNIGALHAELGANDSRQTAEEMKISCTHFQCAAWAFQHLIDNKKLSRSPDISTEILQFFVQIMLAQAQECILEKSMLDNRKASIVTKVSAQVVEYYKSAITVLTSGALNTSSQSSIIEVVSTKLFKEWKKFIEFRLAYYDSICSLYMGNATEEQQKMGERVAWYELADSKYQQAVQLAKQLDIPEINDAVWFVADVISVKLSNAKKENDFIYHEKIPPAASLPTVKGSSLVKGIPFNICDPEVSGPDIFARLVPIEAHETASIYSARKDEILRNTRLKIEEKNQELISYMSSLQLEKETLRTPKEDAIPDALVNVCADLSLHPEWIEEMEKILFQLDKISKDTGKIIQESRQLLKEEEEKEIEHQKKVGRERPRSMIIIELCNELTKHEETHRKAIESNRSLSDNFEQHKDDVLIMTSSSASKIASILPSNKNIKINEDNVTEMERLFDKIDEMKKQRKMLEEQLVKEMDQDNILKLVLNHPKEDIERIFDDEIKKYDKTVGLIEQNLTAQKNILRALTNCNVDYADTRKEIIEVQRNRKTRIASLLYTYQVFKELQANSKKGLEFYQKFNSIVTRLNARIRGVTKVQDEERIQFLEAQAFKNQHQINQNFPLVPSGGTMMSGNVTSFQPSVQPPPMISSTGSSFVIPPGGSTKLKDILPFMKGGKLPSAAASASVTPPISGMIPPSAPSLTPTPPSVPSASAPSLPASSNVQPVIPRNVGYNMATPMIQPQSSASSMLNVDTQLLAATTGSMASQQYSPPPSYSRDISTKITYSLPAVISPIDTTNTVRPTLGDGYYPTGTGGGNVSAHQPISSVLPIVPPPPVQQQPPYPLNHPQYPHPNSINQQQYYISNSGPVASTATTMYNSYGQTPRPVQPVTPICYNQVPGHTTNPGYPVSQPMHPQPIAAATAQIAPLAIHHHSNSVGAYPITQPLHPQPSGGYPSSYQSTAGQQPNQQVNPILTQHGSTTTTVTPGFPIGDHSNHPHPAGCYPTVPNSSTNASYSQQMLPSNNGNYHHPTTSMMNGNYASNSMTMPTNVPAPETITATNNITAILDEESKRGWSVLTPTPVTPPTSNDSKNSVINDSTKTPTTASNSNERSLPDILTTMLTINGGSDAQTTTTTNEPSTRVVSSNNNDNTSNNELTSTKSTTNEPKDLLSQFDPLFT